MGVSEAVCVCGGACIFAVFVTHSDSVGPDAEASPTPEIALEVSPPEGRCCKAVCPSRVPPSPFPLSLSLSLSLSLPMSVYPRYFLSLSIFFFSSFLSPRSLSFNLYHSLSVFFSISVSFFSPLSLYPLFPLSVCVRRFLCLSVCLSLSSPHHSDITITLTSQSL